MPISVVVADGSKARLLTAADVDSPLQNERELAHPESRLREQDLVADGSGSGSDAGGHGKHSMGHEKVAHQNELQTFAREICTEIDRLCRTGGIHRFYLVAAPEFLGMLRAHLSRTAQAKLAGEVGKNLVTQNIKQIRAQLPRRL